MSVGAAKRPRWHGTARQPASYYRGGLSGFLLVPIKRLLFYTSALDWLLLPPRCPTLPLTTPRPTPHTLSYKIMVFLRVGGLMHISPLSLSIIYDKSQFQSQKYLAKVPRIYPRHTLAPHQRCCSISHTNGLLKDTTVLSTAALIFLSRDFRHRPLATYKSKM